MKCISPRSKQLARILRAPAWSAVICGWSSRTIPVVRSPSAPRTCSIGSTPTHDGSRVAIRARGLISITRNRSCRLGSRRSSRRRTPSSISRRAPLTCRSSSSRWCWCRRALRSTPCRQASSYSRTRWCPLSVVSTLWVSCYEWMTSPHCARLPTLSESYLSTGV